MAEPYLSQYEGQDIDDTVEKAVVIDEYGSGTNRQYWKYSDGRLKCVTKKEITTSTPTADGSSGIYRNYPVAIIGVALDSQAYPFTQVDGYLVSATNTSSKSFWSQSIIMNNSYSIQAFSSGSLTDITLTVTLVRWGRWK